MALRIEQKLRLRSPDEVRGILAEALSLVDELEPAPGDREALLTMAVSLLAEEHRQLIDPAATGLPPLRLEGFRGH